MKLKLTAKPQHAMLNLRDFSDFSEVRYVDELTSSGELGVKVGLAVLAAIDNMRKSGEDACDPHWSILVTMRRVEREDDTQKTLPLTTEEEYGTRDF